MRKFLKKNILEIFHTMYEAHNDIKKLIEKKDLDSVNVILGDCQNTAVQIGTAIEGSEGEGFVSVKYLEEYCEAVYQVASEISEFTGSKAQKALDKKLIKAENSVKNDIKVKLEVVFLPYKASMWDSLESIWKAANEDPDCNAYVIPIPYYDKNPDGTFGEMHYEGADMPEYVPIMHYEVYKLELMKPDVIYIHNPYDNNNYVTSVDPRFYSNELKKYTDCLVYVPYFVAHSQNTKQILYTSGALNADIVILQSEFMKKWYYEVYEKTISAQELKNKIYVLGSPKVDNMVRLMNSPIDIPYEWREALNGKKVLFLNSNVSMLLRKSESFIDDMLNMFSKFERRCDEWTVIWREHPLTFSTIKSLRPELMNDYLALKKAFSDKKLGVIDETSNPYPAMLVSDCYYGSGGSMAVLYGVFGKPLLLTNYNNHKILSTEIHSLDALKSTLKQGFIYREINDFSLDIFLDNLSVLDEQKQERLENIKAYVTNTDGSVGYSIHNLIKSKM